MCPREHLLRVGALWRGRSSGFRAPRLQGPSRVWHKRRVGGNGQRQKQGRAPGQGKAAWHPSHEEKEEFRCPALRHRAGPGRALEGTDPHHSANEETEAQCWERCPQAGHLATPSVLASGAQTRWPFLLAASLVLGRTSGRDLGPLETLFSWKCHLFSGQILMEPSSAPGPPGYGNERRHLEAGGLGSA